MSADPSWTLRPIAEPDFQRRLRGDDLVGALGAFAMLLKRPADRIYKTRHLGIGDHHLKALAEEALSPDAGHDPHGFFTSRFSAFEIDAGRFDNVGLLTGFYEPEAEASRVETDDYCVPLYEQPDDLIEVSDGVVNHTLPPDYRFGRKDEGDIKPYHDRRTIESGALRGQGLEIAWLRDPVDAFFIHVQGAALLHMTDGTRMRVTYSAKSGHPFTGIGKLLVDSGEIAPDEISMQMIRTWLATHPDQAQALMWENRSFIFFRRSEFNADDPGPIAAAKVPLTPLRSIAVDRTIHTFGTPFFIRSPSVNDAPFERLMIAQDTGSAIVGPARADIYFGTGAQAGNLAGGVKAHGTFTVLVPKTAVDAVIEKNRIEPS